MPINSTPRLIARIKNLVFGQHKNFLCCVAGKAGSGKSYLSLRLAEALDPTFNIDRVVFQQEDFLSLISSQMLKEGNAIVYEEFGASGGMQTRQWYSTTNQLMNSVFQTFRFMGLIVIVNVPNFKWIDSQTRGLFAAFIETMPPIVNNQVKAKIWWLDPSTFTGEIYKKSPRIVEDRYEIMLFSYFKHPSKALTKAYEEKHKIYKWQYVLDAQRGIELGKRMKESMEKRFLTTIDEEEIINNVLSDPTAFQNQRGKFVGAKIAAAFNTGDRKGQVLAEKVKLRIALKLKKGSSNNSK